MTVLQSLRKLVECYQVFDLVASRLSRTSGLTHPQFDVIATLGNTQGMTFSELGRRTLITKGTLTGVVDRLEDRGLVRRVAHHRDGRSTLVELTGQGHTLFRSCFPAVAGVFERAFATLTESEHLALDESLARCRAVLDEASRLAAVVVKDAVPAEGCAEGAGEPLADTATSPHRHTT